MNTLKQKIEEILTPPAPRDAVSHGGVKNWDYYYNKEGLKFLVDQLLSLFESYQAEQVKEIEGLKITHNFDIRLGNSKPLQERTLKMDSFNKALSQVLSILTKRQ